ncbi:Tetratricopeptide-like helical [Venustampulla echinocandica]|uniref:Tetratricopeptide-like helical n=1 Tax=Venustampulla echinocandica TaxID=2656787 RepID=A0A370TA19_9HELO|nr:Tetratricopeptide-like helical [Venustampulla echinocandica]RDL30658.1 Tetratricopeptide-like helical [Venustampulla echinocandica]
MTVTVSEPLDNNLSSLWHSACKDYARDTGITLTDERFPKVQGPEDLSSQLDSEKDNFEDFRMKKRPLFHAMQMVVAPFESWGDLIAGVASAAFPPASSIMGAMLLLVRAARRVSDAFNVIIDLFHQLGNFAQRLASYNGVLLSEGMKTIIVKVLVNFLRVCAASQKLLSQGSFKARFSKWAKNMLVEDTSISSLLDDLAQLTSQEHMMVSAQSLNLTHQALRNTEELLGRDDRRNDRERLERVKAALDPVSASGQVFSSITQNRIPGSGSWVEDRIRSWWQGSHPLLWLHGGPGVGKSHLASKIITDLSNEKSSVTPAPVVASFFYKNNDVDLRSLNKALRTLAWQVAMQQSSFAVHAEEFCIKDDPENSYVVWEKLFLKYFTDAPSDIATCLVIDGIDEASTEEQEVLFSLLEKTFLAEDDMSRTLPLRVVLLSRDSVRGMFDEHSLSWIPEIEVGNNQNKDDLHQYVSQKLQTTKLFRGSPEFQEEIINNISQEAEGLWEWANLVVKSVLRCRTKEQIRKMVRTMPRGISAMLHEELQRLNRELSGLEELSGDEASDGEGTATQIDQLNVLLSFVALAQKPLTVRQLDIILELILKEEFLSLEDDIRTVYSSLFSIRANDSQDGFDENSDVVILRHSSFYDFFRTSGEPGPIHVNVDRAEANFLYVCLYALRENYTPYSERFMEGLSRYAEKFLPSHLSRANPEKAGNLQGKISALLASLFSKGQDTELFISEYKVKEFASYSFYPTCELTELGSYWLDAQDRDTANKRAEVVLSWLLPDSKQMFVDNALSSAVASDACPFTVLLSLMVSSWSQRWLEPDEIKDDDGLPAIAPAILTVYNAMATEMKESNVDGLTAKVSNVMWNYREPARVLLPAESQKLQQTPMWHARVAQALLLHQCHVPALDHFQISLDENQKTPTFSSQSLSVIHRDMARACTEMARHKEALEHSELSETLHSTLKESDDRFANDAIDDLLNKAQMKHHAKLTDDAIETAEEAWKLILKTKGEDRDTRLDLLPFFSIFLELNQPHRLRSVFDFAFTHFEEPVESKITGRPLDFESFILDCFIFRPRIMYRVLHYALAHGDQHYLDLTASALKKVDTEHDSPEELKYLFATVLFEKGRRDVAVQGWYEVASLSEVSSFKWDQSSRIRSIGHLVALCLDDADIPFCERPPLTMDGTTEFGDVYLVLASWLRDHGDITNAKDALRWCVKECISLLSDDDPSNDINAFVRLFRTFLAVTDSDEDLGAALYLIKQSTEPRRRVARNRTDAVKALDGDGQVDVSRTLENVQLTDDEDQSPDGGDEDDIDDVLFSGTVCDPLTECWSCKREIGSIHHWYFCRSCPFSTLCWRCYRQFKSDDSSKFSGICDPKHEFYYTGALLRPFERVPKGMVPLVDSDGEKRTIWVEEWKDKLAEKWETADSAYEGTLSAWCMRVLPEPQKARWATLFQT